MIRDALVDAEAGRRQHGGRQPLDIGLQVLALGPRMATSTGAVVSGQSLPLRGIDPNDGEQPRSNIGHWPVSGRN